MRTTTEKFPNVATLLGIEQKLQELYHSVAADMIPSVRERLQDLTVLIKAGNDTLRATVVSSLIALNLDLETPPASLEEEDLLRLRQSVLAEMAEAQDAIKRVADYSPPDIAALQWEHQAALEKLRTALGQVELLAKQQAQRLAEIDELLVTLDRPSVRNALRNLIPQEEDIDSILTVWTDPTLSPQVLKAALAKLNKHLDLLEQGRQFADVQRARNKLAEQLAQQQQTVAKLREKLQAQEQQAERFVSIDELIAQRGVWLGQTNLFLERWQVLSQAIADATLIPGLRSALDAARAYLLALRRCFEAAR